LLLSSNIFDFFYFPFLNDFLFWCLLLLSILVWFRSFSFLMDFFVILFVCSGFLSFVFFCFDIFFNADVCFFCQPFFGSFWFLFLMDFRFDACFFW
jgi:hypothetical protein